MFKESFQRKKERKKENIFLTCLDFAENFDFISCSPRLFVKMTELFLLLFFSDINAILTSLERELIHDTGCINNFEFKRENDVDLLSYLTKWSDISYLFIINILLENRVGTLLCKTTRLVFNQNI